MSESPRSSRTAGVSAARFRLPLLRLPLLRRPRTRGLAALAAVLVGLLLGGVPHSLARPATDAETLWGPRRFEATRGRSQLHVESFAAEARPGTRTFLVVERQGATASTLRLNGASVFSASELSARSGTLRQAVELRAQNTLELSPSGPAGGALTLSVLRERDPTFAVLEARRFVRAKGPPQTVVERFGVSATAGRPYVLHVRNGRADGSARLSSAEIRLNGQLVVGPDAFNPQVGRIEREVTLRSQNELSAVLRSGPGNELTLWVTATDVTPPVLEIASPAEGGVTGQAQVEASGRVVDETTVRVEIDGVEAALSGEGFSATVPLEKEGENALLFRAEDAAGLVTTETRTVIRDSEAPRVSLSSPVEGRITKLPTVTVAGTITDRTAVQANVNGVPLSLDAAGAFTAEVPLVGGTNFVAVTATDGAGHATTEARQVVLDTQAPELEIDAPAEGLTTEAAEVEVSGRVRDATAVTLTVQDQPAVVGAEGRFAAVVALGEGANALTVVATDGAGNASTAVVNVTRAADSPLGADVPEGPIPADPATVAPPVDATVATTLGAATEFLYTGAGAIQTGVEAGTIDPVRVSVLRGRVLRRDGSALEGVRVSVQDHPELGQTISRADGAYDLAVNGGGFLVLDFERSGHFAVQRPVSAEWQDYTPVEDVVLVTIDPAVTAVDLSAGAGEVQVHRATMQEDADGPRQATLLFEPGTEAHLQMADGTTLAVPELSIRATEYTVGEDGPRALPGPLPPTSGYTYAVELSADEAIRAGAEHVVFSKPVPFYVENFLGFPVGIPVPAAYYDRQKAAWVPMDDGRIIRVVSTEGGIAAVDADGDGAADDAGALEPLGIDDAERRKLAATYAAGAELWRVQLSHFSPIDLNYPVEPEGEDPKEEPKEEEPEDCPATQSGSIIECENQALGERIAIVGTPYTLNYRSTRVPGRTAARTVQLPLTGADVPANLREVRLHIAVAGRTFEERFAPAPNLSYTFTWDGNDAYGRPVHGARQATVSIGHVYPMTYRLPAATARSFGLSCAGDPLRPGWESCVIPQSVNEAARQEATRWKRRSLTLAALDARTLGLGGWTLDAHHVYDAPGQVLRMGDGTERKAARRWGRGVIENLAGTGVRGTSGDGGRAEDAQLEEPGPIAVAPDGSIYVAGWEEGYLRRISPRGIITPVMGGGERDDWCGEPPCGDGGPAAQASFWNGVEDLASGADGSLYIADGSMIRRIAPDGTVSTVAGSYTGSRDYTAVDGVPAAGTPIGYTWGLTVAPDGSIFFVESGNRVPITRVRKISPDGILRTVVGGLAWPSGDASTAACRQDGVVATQACLDFATAVALAPGGELYVLEPYNRLMKLEIDGRLSHVSAGEDASCEGSTDGEHVSATGMCGWRLRSDRFGRLYYDDLVGPCTPGDCGSDNRLRMIDLDGTVTTLAGGNGYCDSGPVPDPTCGDGGPATSATISYYPGFEVAPDGAIVIGDLDNHRVRWVGPVLPDYSAAAMEIVAEGGDEVYDFDEAGRHLRTRDALTGALRHRFGYSADGLLVSVTDADGLTTGIERGDDGSPTAVVSPFGRRTALDLGADGLLARITNPAGESIQAEYGPGGLLTAFRDPRGAESRYAYDASGRLLRAEDPAGGTKSLERVELPDGYAVDVRTALGRTTTYAVERLDDGGVRRSTTLPTGQRTTTEERTDGTTTLTSSDGTATTVVSTNDPRHGMQAPILEGARVSTPAGLTMTIDSRRTTLLADPFDPLSLLSQTDEIRVNGRTHRSVFDAVAREITDVTAAGRQTVTRVDAEGRVLEVGIPGVLPLTYTYDASGRLAEREQGGARWRYSYDQDGFLAESVDPLGRTRSYAYDEAGRVVRQVRPDGAEIGFGYDAGGNLAWVAPAGRPRHALAFNGANLLEAYTAPGAGGASTTRYRYNLDRQLTRIERPEAEAVDFVYDGAGRLTGVRSGTDAWSHRYAPAGQLLQVDAPGGVGLSFEYDGSLVTLATWSGPVAGSVGVAYDSDFRMSAMQVNGAGPIAFTYDADGLLIGAGALSLTRDPGNGMLTASSLGSVATAVTHDDFGRLAGSRTTRAAQELFSTEHTRDALGRITAVRETTLLETGAPSTRTSTFAYDPTGRLLGAAWTGGQGDGEQEYEYDANGNRVRLVATGALPLLATYDDQDRLLIYGDAAYTYAAAGELLLKSTPAGSTRYAYDAMGNLREVVIEETDPARTTRIEYLIDGQNRRVGRRKGAELRGFLYQDQLNPVAELDGAGQVVSRFVYASQGHVPDYMIRGGETYRLITDHLGSVRMVVRERDGSVAQRLEYDPFGRVTRDSNPHFQPFGFAGGLHDPETGLVRFGARDYDPETGRWLSKDPLGFGARDPNLYSYARNDPVNLVDASGLCPTDPQQECLDPLNGMDLNIRTASSNPNIGEYGMTRRNADGSPRPHQGVDILAPVGSPVSAVGDGTVAFAGTQNGHGNIVVVEHASLAGMTTVFTAYSHLNAISGGIRTGAPVSAGQIIGAAGLTGNAPGTPPHLHFELRSADPPGRGLNNRLDPALYLCR